jgi:hypothetical protein
VHSRYRLPSSAEPSANHAALLDARRSIGIYQVRDERLVCWCCAVLIHTYNRSFGIDFE